MIAALELATGKKPDLVWHQETALPSGIDLIVLPGGFSFGDYLRSGAIAARSPIMVDIVRRAGEGRAPSKHDQRNARSHTSEQPFHRLSPSF